MISRFFGHFWTSFKASIWIVLCLGVLGAITSILSNAVGPSGAAVSIVGVLASFFIMIVLAAKCHLMTIRNEQPDIVAITDGRVNRWRFVKTLVLVMLATSIPLLLKFLASSGTMTIGNTQIDTGPYYSAMDSAFVGLLFAAVSVFILVAFSPFIPRALTNFTMPIMEQIAVNLSNWKRGLFYIVVCALIPHLILSTVATSALIYSMMSVQIMGAAFTAILAIMMFVITAFNGISVILFSTAFSMHFLDTFADETTTDDAQ